MDKAFPILVIILLVLGAALTIMQIWFPLMDWETFGKIILTLLILGILCALLIVIKSDFFSQRKKLKDENYLD